jgi:SAM-dependent methyltransferase
MISNCPLCLHEYSGTTIPGADHRAYHFCNNCSLVHADPAHHLSIEEEKKRYLNHTNGIEYTGYVQFLRKAINPALKHLKPGSYGLDFGCGHNPTLSKLLTQQGFSCDYYDPLFFPELDGTKKYDFIFSTECFEHFSQPAKELNKIQDILKKDGYIIVMTELWKSPGHFKNWYYTRDPSHVSFYHSQTLDFMTKAFNWQILYNDGTRVFVFKSNKLKESGKDFKIINNNLTDEHFIL